MSVSLVMERAVVMHDPQKVTAEKIQEIIEESSVPDTKPA